MNRITETQNDARIESLYRAAEHRAEERRGSLATHAKADSFRPIAESSLVREAAIERERHLVRKRFLPSDLSCEWAWTILLDVFVNEQHARGTSLSHLASKHGLSELTAARQIAAIIEYGLIKRYQAITEPKESEFKTTTSGRKIVMDVLNSFHQIF